MSITPDTKDWTWVLAERCPQCGFTASEVPLEAIASTALTIQPVWEQVLQSPHVAVRPAPQVWSPLEYGAHVADVLKIMRERLELMLAQDNPGFANWDQDQAAIEGKYGDRTPHSVLAELTENLTQFCTAFGAVEPTQQDRTGMRSNGSAFTVLTLGQYALHDLIHHVWDVTKESK